MAADLLTTIRAEIDARLRELRPLLAEYERLTSATDALAHEGALASEGRSVFEPARPRRAAKKAARPKAARPKTAGTKAARPKTAGTKAARPKTAGTKAARPKTAGTKTAGTKTAGTKTARPQKTARPAGGRVVRRGPSIGPAGQAILAALEHGSHTVAELVVVTALPASDIRKDLRPLLKLEAIVKAERDGKTAYVLPA
jgi:hypothetical protein